MDQEFDRHQEFKWENNEQSLSYYAVHDMYFIVGDNRINSADSIIIGLIDKDIILGKANFVLFPFSKFGTVKQNNYVLFFSLKLNSNM